MPIYEYECEKCGKIIEAYQQFADAPLKKCEYCSGKLNKLISHSTFHLKGTGWYVTDYGKGTGTSAASSGNKGEKGKKKTEKKSEGKAET